MSNNICDSCLLSKALCACPSAAQPTAVLAPAPPDTSTTCTGYIDGRGLIAHPDDCALHRFRKPVPGAWQCPATVDDYGDSIERCESEGFSINGTAQVDAALDGYVLVNTSGGTVSVEAPEFDAYGTEFEVKDFTDIENIMCYDYEHELYPGDPGFDEAVALWRSTL